MNGFLNNWDINRWATGEQLYQHRRKANLTQEYLAELLDVSRVIISMWESGRKMPSWTHMVNLAKLYGCTLDELVVTYQRSRERDDRDQPVPLQINIYYMFGRMYAFAYVRLFLFCKLAVSGDFLSNQYNKIIDFRGGLSHENIRRSCFPGRSF